MTLFRPGGLKSTLRRERNSKTCRGDAIPSSYRISDWKEFAFRPAFGWRLLGSDVVCGDRILEVLAGEVTVDLPAPATGRLVEQHVAEDDILATGQLLGVIEEAGEEDT